MNELHAKMLKSVSLAVIAFGAIVYVYNYARSIDRTYPPRTFSVEGSADVDTTPDVAMFSATVTTEGGENVAQIQGQNSEKMEAINAFVKEQGVDEKDLKTLQYNLYPRYSNAPCVNNYCPPATINGYTLTQTLEVKVRDTEKLNALLSGVVEKGANTVSDVRFVLDDDTEAKNQAREEAIAKARAKAKDIAKATGFRLGEIVTMYEMNTDPGMPYYGGMGGAMEMSAKANAMPSIEPGTQSTRVTVTLTYEIER